MDLPGKTKKMNEKFTEYHLLDCSHIEQLYVREKRLREELEGAEKTNTYIKKNPPSKGEFENRKIYEDKTKKWLKDEEKKHAELIKSIEAKLKKATRELDKEKNNLIKKLKKIKRLDDDFVSVKYNAKKEIANVSIDSITTNLDKKFSGLSILQQSGLFPVHPKPYIDYSFTGSASIPIEVAEKVITNLRKFGKKDTYITCSFKKIINESSKEFNFHVGWDICSLNIFCESINKSFPIE